jgi:hypothetical protein
VIPAARACALILDEGDSKDGLFQTLVLKIKGSVARDPATELQRGR